MKKYIKTKKNRKVIIFGGLGFIGRNLALKLLGCGEKVTLVEYDLSKRNLCVLKKIKNLKVIKGNILDKKSVSEILKEKYDVLYNLAAHSGPKASIEYPFLDLETNILGSLNILKEAKKYKNMVVIFLGSRLEYGEVSKNPVSEDETSNPTTIYGLTKFTASKFHLLYNKLFSVKTVVVRGANPYGPHLYNPNPSYNIINFFIDKAVRNEEIDIFDTAKNQVKDYIYIDDFCEALYRLSKNSNVYGQMFNLGYGKGIKFIDAAKTIVDTLKKGKIKIIKQDILSKKIEAKDYVSNIKKIQKYTGWKPETDFISGVKKTIVLTHPIFKI